MAKRAGCLIKRKQMDLRLGLKTAWANNMIMPTVIRNFENKRPIMVTKQAKTAQFCRLKYVD